MNSPLDVYCLGELAGQLTAAGSAELRFEYAESWLDAGRPPLSLSMPTGASSQPASVHNFFDGLLPEGGIRKLVARELHVSSGNTIGLLEWLGWDCAGAVSVYPHGAQPVADGDGSDVGWLSDTEIATLVDELPRRPLLVDADGELRISLAGAQDKLPVIVGDDGRIGLGHGDLARNRRTPSTHILKTPIERLPDSVANEAFCLRLADAVGLKAAYAEPRKVADREFLLVRRFDRRRQANGVVGRLHQEDFCQALGVAVNRKYEAEGGPGLAQLFGTLREASAVPAVDLPQLLGAIAFNLMIANHDAHAKNFSIIYDSRGGAGLAPLYDLVSTFVYRPVDHHLAAKLAMKIGDEFRMEWIQGRHFDKFFDQCGLNPSASRRRIVELAEEMPETAERVLSEFDANGWRCETVDRIVRIVRERSAMVLDELAGS